MKRMYVDFNKLLKDAVPSTLIQDVTRETAKYFNSPEYREQEFQRRAGVARLMNQVVGAEVF